MKPSLFLSDFDGTLVSGGAPVSARNRAAIARYRDAGGTFVLCSGRMPASIADRARELGLTSGYVVAYQGTTVFDLGTGERAVDGALDTGPALRALRFLESRGYHIHVYTADTLYCNRADTLLDRYEKITGTHAVIPQEPLSVLAEEKGLRIAKMLVVCDPAERETIFGEVAAAVDGDCMVTSSDATLVEVVSARYSKGTALRLLAERLGIPRERTGAVGNERNDLPMIETAGWGYAVANAEEIVRRAAHVVPDCGADGVAAALEDFTMRMEGKTI